MNNKYIQIYFFQIFFIAIFFINQTNGMEEYSFGFTGEDDQHQESFLELLCDKANDISTPSEPSLIVKEQSTISKKNGYFAYTNFNNLDFYRPLIQNNSTEEPHQDIKNFTCPLCFVTYTNLEQFQSHIHEHKEKISKKLSRVKNKVNQDCENKVNVLQNNNVDAKLNTMNDNIADIKQLMAKFLAVSSQFVKKSGKKPSGTNKKRKSGKNSKKKYKKQKIKKSNNLSNQNKQVACTQCGQCFTRSTTCNDHFKKFHEGGKISYNCSVCNKCYKDEKRSKNCCFKTCDICQMQLPNVQKLSIHKKELHPNLIYCCQKCKKYFASFREAKDCCVTYECKVCKCSFDAIKDLFEHSKLHK